MKHLIFTLIILIATSKSFAQPGTLDKSFAVNGIMIDSVFAKGDIKIQPDQKILVTTAGPINENFNGFMLVRYLPDGTLDTEFGESGISKLNNEGGISSLSLLPDGKIIAGGGYENMILVKCLPNGRLDSSFGTDGQVYYKFPGIPNAGISKMQLQTDGKIVVVGVARIDDFSSQGILARFNVDGNIDESFGNGNGYITIASIIGGSSLRIQSDGKILVGATTRYDYKFATARYLPNGTLDSSFGNNGFVITSFNYHRQALNDLALQPDGKILAAGYCNEDIGYPIYTKMAVVRYNSDGSPDGTFGEDGAALLSFQDTNALGRRIALQPDGSIILAGEKSNRSSFSIPVIVKLSEAGKTDVSFGENGFAFISVEGFANINAVALQPDNKILLSGSSAVTNPDNVVNYSLLARLNNNVSLKQAIIAKVKRWIKNHHNGIVWQNTPGTTSYVVERSKDGINWQAVSSKQVALSQQTSLNYYADPSLETGTSYYRVQTTSSDNATSISNSVAITNNDSNAFTGISLYPNPVKDNLHIKGLDGTLSYNVKITDQSGSMVASTTIHNNVVYNFNVQRFNKGIYYIKVVCENSDDKNTMLKFLKE